MYDHELCSYSERLSASLSIPHFKRTDQKDRIEIKKYPYQHTLLIKPIKIGLNCAYRASTITGHTVYFIKRTGHLKMRYSQFFSLSEHNKHTKLHMK